MPQSMLLLLWWVWGAGGERLHCPTRFVSDLSGGERRVRLGVCVVSKRENVEARDAIRSTWCLTGHELNSKGGGTSVVVRFFVGLSAEPLGIGDDGLSADVTVLSRVDGASAVPYLRLEGLLSGFSWAPFATHFLSVDDDAYPFLDRLSGELERGTVPSEPWARLEPPFVWGWFMTHGNFGPWPFAAGFGKLLTADLVATLRAAASDIESDTPGPAESEMSGGTRIGVHPLRWKTTASGSTVSYRASASRGASSTRTTIWDCYSRRSRIAGSTTVGFTRW